MDIDQIRTKLTDREVGTIGKHKFFSVCIPLVPTDEGLSVLMEVRASELKTQPGGRRDTAGMCSQRDGRRNRNTCGRS